MIYNKTNIFKIIIKQINYNMSVTYIYDNNIQNYF